MAASLVLFLVLGGAASALDTKQLQPRGYVNDFAGVLDARGAQELEAYCGDVERATQAQFAVVTVPSLEGEPIEDVAVRLFEQWGIGKKGTDEGLLVLLAIEDRKYRVEVGYGLEPIINDAFAGDVMRSVRPILRQGDYTSALHAAARQFGERIAAAKGVSIGGEPVRRPQSSRASGAAGLVALLILMIVLSLLAHPARNRSNADLLAGMLLGSMMGRNRGGIWSHGGFGGGEGFRGGFGGFGGFGGGRSGGGGASGGW